MSRAFTTIFGNLEAELRARGAVCGRSTALARLGTLLGCKDDGGLLVPALGDALPTTLTLTEAEDLLIHAASYVGFAYVQRAMAAWVSTLSPEQSALLAQSRDERSARPLDVRFDEGVALYSVLDASRVGQQVALYGAVSPDYYRHVMATFGCTFGRSTLSVREREIVTVAILAALGTAPRQLAFHIRVALEQGVTREQLAETLLYTQLYAGLPAANNAAAVAVDEYKRARN